jgi:hypothetical protein
MHTLRFGRKLSLPSTIAIKHQVRTLMAHYEVKKAEALKQGLKYFVSNRASRSLPRCL